MHQRTVTVVPLLLALLACRDGPSAPVGPVQQHLAPSAPGFAASRQAVQHVTDMLDDPFVQQLVRDVDDRGTVSRLRHLLRDGADTATDDQRLTLHRALATAQDAMLIDVDAGDQESQADREVMRAVLALVLADVENTLNGTVMREVTEDGGQR